MEKVKIGEEIIWDSQLLSDWIIIRPTSIWGPWTVKTSFNQFFKMVESGYFFNLSKKSGIKTFGFVLNSVNQIEKLLFNNSNNEIFYIGDKEPYLISEWADEISLALKGKKNIQLPYIIFLYWQKLEMY